MVYNLSFWDSILGDKVLFFQPDSAMCQRSPFFIEMFLAFDFIGAPLPWIYTPVTGATRKVTPTDNNFHAVNGGFSLRSKQSMIKCVQAVLKGNLTFPSFKGDQEDMFFSRCLQHYLKHQKLPTRRVASAFAVESIIDNEQPLGIHKAWKHLKNEDWVKLVSNCPEAEAARAISRPMPGYP